MGKASGFIQQLPDIQECQRMFKAAAMLDAILMPEWQYRYYSYNAHWDVNEQMASLRDGNQSVIERKVINQLRRWFRFHTSDGKRKGHIPKAMKKN
nr:hypothetical protein [Paenibacillus xylanexedens]